MIIKSIIIAMIAIVIITVILLMGWFLYKMSKMADEFYQWARIVNNKIDKIKNKSDYNNALRAYNKLIHLDTLGKGYGDIMRLKGRLEEKFKQLYNGKDNWG